MKNFTKIFIASTFVATSSILSVKASEEPKNYRNVINKFINSYKINTIIPANDTAAC